MVKEYLISFIRFFLYFIAISIALFYLSALTLTTTYGKETVKDYLFGESLEYLEAKVEPSLIGVKVSLKNFKYNSLVFFEGDELDFELNLLNSLISQKIYLERLNFKDGKIAVNKNIFQNQREPLGIFVKNLQISNLDIGNTSFENINLNNFLSENGKYGFNFSNLDIQLPGSVKSISNLEGFGLFKTNKLSLFVRSRLSQLELSFLQEAVFLDLLQGFLKLDFQDSFSIDYGLFSSKGEDLETRINLKSKGDLQVNLNVNGAFHSVKKLIPNRASQATSFLEKNSFDSPSANLLINFSSIGDYDNYSLIANANKSNLEFNTLNLYTPLSTIYADNSRLVVYGEELQANDTLLRDYIITSKQSIPEQYNFFTTLPNMMPLNFRFNSNGGLASVNGLFKNEDNSLSVTFSNQKLFFGMNDIGVEMDFITNLSIEGNVFRIYPKNFKSNIFFLNDESVNFFDFDLDSLSIRNINLDLDLNENSKQSEKFSNLSYEGLKIKTIDSYVSIKDEMSFGGQVSLSGTKLSYNDSSFNIPALRVLSLIDIQSNLTNFFAADFERLNQNNFIVNDFDGELYFDSVGYINIKELNLSFDIGTATIKGTISSNTDQFDTFNLDLDFFSQISDNIPWYVAIIGGIPAAAGAVVVTDILEQDLRQISKSSYEINGNIGNLKITSKEQ